MQDEALRVIERLPDVQARVQRCMLSLYATACVGDCSSSRGGGDDCGDGDMLSRRAHADAQQPPPPLLLVLDVFAVLDVSPCVGVLLLCGAHAHAQAVFAEAVWQWWSSSSSRCDGAAALPRVRMLRVQLVLVHVPGVYMCLALRCVDDKSSRSTHARSAAVCGVDGVTGQLHLLHIMCVVCDVYYASRHARRPLPWVRVRVLLSAHTPSLPPSSSSSSSSLRALAMLQPTCDCHVDLRLLQPRVRRRVAVVGQLVELRGRRVAAHDAATAVATDARCVDVPHTPPAITVHEYVEAHHAHVTLSTSALCMSDDDDNNNDDSSSAYTRSAAAAVCGGADTCAQQHAATTACAPSSAAAAADDDNMVETAAARHAVHCWTGLRVALGVEDATMASCNNNNGNNKDDKVVCNDAFVLSLDAIVALLVTLVSAQLPTASAAVSLLLVDECAGTSTVLSAVRRLWARGCVACVDAHLIGALRGGDAAWLPRYTTLTQPHPLPLSSSSSAAATTTATTMYSEVVSAGVLSTTSRRTLLVRGVEALSRRALGVLQGVLGAAVVTDTTRCTHAGGCGCGGNNDNNSHICDDEDEDDEEDDVHWCVVRREGGQAVTCTATRSLLLTLTRARELPARAALFELAQRMHVMLRPSYNAARACAVAVHASRTHALRALLRQRAHAQWLPLLCRALALPHEAMQWPSRTRSASAPQRQQSQQQQQQALPCVLTHALYATPRLTLSCSALLHTYFLAAKAVAGAAVDASMMDTLVRLTNAHAALRVRLLACAVSSHSCRNDDDTHGCCRCRGCDADDAARAMIAAVSLAAAVAPHMLPPPRSFASSLSSCNDAAMRVAAPTMLIDAVVAVGLCDATLHLFTGKTLLGQCVFVQLERLVRRTACACTAAGNNNDNGNNDNSDDDSDNAKDAEAVADATAFAHDVAVTTRPWPACLCTSSALPDGFAMRTFVDELMRRLQDMVCAHHHDEAAATA